MFFDIHGLEVYRSRGVFYLYFHYRKGQPQALGRRIFRSIPKDVAELATWAASQRAKLSNVLQTYNTLLPSFPANEQCVDERYVVVQRTPPNMRDLDDRVKYCYMIDLDYMLFHFQCVPLYHLDNLPSETDMTLTLQTCRCAKMHWCAALLHITPRRLQFDLTRIKPRLVKNKNEGRCGVLAHNTSIERVVDIVANANELLSLRDELSDGETTYLRVLEHYVGGYLESRGHVMIQEVGLVDSPDKIGPHGREIALTLACAALVPIHLLDPDPAAPHYLKRLFSDNKKDHWFVREHICLTLATMLHDEKNAQDHVSRLVNAIMATADTPAVVYGVVFSLYACIVVRVDKAAGGSFTRTETLDYLPSIYADSWDTAGMGLLVRLGHLRAADDIDYFYELLRPMWWMQDIVQEDELEEDTCTGSEPPKGDPSDLDLSALNLDLLSLSSRPTSPTPPTPYLPLDVLTTIASHIPVAEHLFAFALASRTTLIASLPYLRLPHIRRAPLPRTAHPHWPWDLRATYALGIVVAACMRPHSAYGPGEHGAFVCAYRGCAARLEVRCLRYGEMDGEVAWDWDWEGTIGMRVRKDFDGSGMPEGAMVLPTMTSAGGGAWGAEFMERARVEFRFCTFRSKALSEQAHRYACDKPCEPPSSSDSISEWEENSSEDDYGTDDDSEGVSD
ncbi:hypothetical protein EIP86_001459 [Pleurotus ostreatoroseus]|nr:hypothetical protein EIP86_001459 [Pleurotus ostreatoroseus]